MPVGRVVIVSDRTVGDLYGKPLRASLRTAGIDSLIATVPCGEASKALDTVAGLYSRLIEAELHRDDTLIALGGGVVSDTAGFVAATYLRGIEWVVVPSTLLAMVDAGIGGKTAINLPEGKNLVGAFKQPRVVAIDPSLLVSLDDEVLRSGLAEVVKAALIGDMGLLEALEQHGPPAATEVAPWTDIVRAAATVKAAVVSSDPEERGARMALNLGHTFAHGLESATHFRLPHGEAVSIGLVAAAMLAERLGLAERPLAERLESLLLSLGLPVRYSAGDADDVLAAMSRDKKRRSGGLRFALPRRPGEISLVDNVPLQHVREVLKALELEPEA